MNDIAQTIHTLQDIANRETIRALRDGITHEQRKAIMERVAHLHDACLELITMKGEGEK